MVKLIIASRKWKFNLLSANEAIWGKRGESYLEPVLKSVWLLVEMAPMGVNWTEMNRERNKNDY